MIKIQHIEISTGAGEMAYERLMNDPEIKVLFEKYSTNKDGDAFATIKYEELVVKDSKEGDCAPYR
jgi:hypothetical protein